MEIYELIEIIESSSYVMTEDERVKTLCAILFPYTTPSTMEIMEMEEIVKKYV